MIRKQTTTFAVMCLLGASGNSQTPPTAPASKPAATAAPAQTKPATARPATRPAAPKAVTPVDNVVALLKAKMSESLIMKSVHEALSLTPADMLKLKDAGASENLIGYLMDPASASTSTPKVITAGVPAAAPVVVTPVTTPAPAPVPAAALVNPAPDLHAQKKRVVVDPFDYSAVMTSVQTYFHTNQNIGKGIQALLVTRLAKDGKVVVVERGKVKEVMQEQDFTAGNRAKQGTGSRIGRISGADAILAGDITIFGRDDKKQSGTVAAIGGYCRLCGAIGGAHKEEKAVVAITYRLIDAETTEIIATGEARGESVRKSNNFAAAFAKAYTGAGAAAIDMSSSNFAETIIGEATTDCVNKLSAILNEQATTMKKRVREVDSTVVDVQGNSLMISAGSGEGVNVGEVFEVLESIREVKDPTTGEVLDRVTEKRGELVISSVRDKVSLGTYTGTAPAQVKFLARKKVPPQQ